MNLRERRRLKMPARVEKANDCTLKKSVMNRCSRKYTFFVTGKACLSVMMPELSNQDGIQFNSTDYPVLIVDTPRPVA